MPDELSGFMNLASLPAPEQAELQRYADEWNIMVVGYDMYGKEVGRAWPRKEQPSGSGTSEASPKGAG